MILIDRSETDPYFNIAAEEYVLKEMDEDVFMLWINEPSVIVGKHQVAAAEANLVFTWQNNIPVIRRISGGGTVYHDTGNLNYSVIRKGEHGKLVDYSKHSATVIRALAGRGISAELQGKSNLVIDGMKFSGNAEHVYHDKVLHHGTLLYNTDLELLRKCIRPDHRDYVDRSIRSNDSSIINLNTRLKGNGGIHDLRKILLEQIREDNPGIRDYSFSEKDTAAIQDLALEKYRSSEWNFSYSPRYELRKEIEIGQMRLKLELKTEKGYIREFQLFNGSKKVMEDLGRRFIDVLHHPENITMVIEKIPPGKYFDPGMTAAFIAALF